MNKLIKLFLLLTLLEMLPATVCHASEAPSVAVITAVVTEKSIGETLVAYGVLDPDPDQVLSLSLPHAGLINRVWVRLGQRVKSGDKLLEVVTAPDARMQYLQAKSTVDFAQQELKRTQRLLKEQLATKAKVDAARKTLSDAKAALEALRKRGLDLAEETLLAPMDGIITQLDVAQGQRVQADTTAMLIAAEKRLIARPGVEAEDLGFIEPGTPVTITSVFVPEVRVKSEIREIHAMINPATHLVDVLAPIPENQIDHLILGSHIIGRIHLPMHPALMVPRSAVLGDDADAFVYIVKEGKAHKVNVRIGLEQNNKIEVSGNIKAGDNVVTQGNYELSEGALVRDANK